MLKWLIDIAQVVSAIGVTLLVIEIVYFKRSFCYQALHDIFEIQNNGDFKKMIWLVCSTKSLHEVKSKSDNDSLPDDVAAAVREVSNKFDDVGLLINKKLLDRDAFLAKYFERVLTCYEACRNYIKYERVGTRGYYYQEHFIDLNKMAEKFNNKKFNNRIFSWKKFSWKGLSWKIFNRKKFNRLKKMKRFNPKIAIKNDIIKREELLNSSKRHRRCKRIHIVVGMNHLRRLNHYTQNLLAD